MWLSSLLSYFHFQNRIVPTYNHWILPLLISYSFALNIASTWLWLLRIRSVNIAIPGNYSSIVKGLRVLFVRDCLQYPDISHQRLRCIRTSIHSMTMYASNVFSEIDCRLVYHLQYKEELIIFFVKLKLFLKESKYWFHSNCNSTII